MDVGEREAQRTGEGLRPSPNPSRDCDLDVVREEGGVGAVGFAGAGEEEAVGGGGRARGEPVAEGGNVHAFAWENRVVAFAPGVDFALVGHRARLAGGFGREGDRLEVAADERRNGLRERAEDEPLADEELAGERGVRGGEVAADAVLDREPPEHGAARGARSAGLRVPRFARVGVADDTAGERLDPRGVDGGGAARPEARGVDELRGDDPRRRRLRLREAGAGEEPEARAVRTAVFLLLGVPDADVREQAGDEPVAAE